MLLLFANPKDRFACSKFRYYTFLLEYNKDTDQIRWLRNMVCAFVIHKPKERFSQREAYLFQLNKKKLCVKIVNIFYPTV